jgi:CO dehydrogenase/acetyl-CoA synthase alpha subunit
MAENTVTISLDKYDELKAKVSGLNQEVNELRSIKKPTHYIQLKYDFIRDGEDEWDYVVINEDNMPVEFDKIVKKEFNELFLKSKELRFYNKFPRWVHKLFKCEK